MARFSALANKSTGSVHPKDGERWDDFLVWAHISGKRSGTRLTVENLERWLVDAERWPEEQAADLAIQFEQSVYLAGRRADAPGAVLNVPVLCVDTCSLLDLIRDPMRSDVSAQDVSDTLGLMPLIQEAAVIGLMAGEVKRELDERRTEDEEEARNSLRKYHSAMQKIDCLAAHYDDHDGLDLNHRRQQATVQHSR